jgi:hypothetical protein
LEYISKPNFCLTGEQNKSLKIAGCDGNDQKQLWGWDKEGNLRNKLSTGSCAVVVSNDQVMLQSCDVAEEQWTRLPFALKTKTGRYLAVNSANVSYLDSNSKGRWRRFGDPSTNICNYTGKRHRKSCITLVRCRRHL